MKRALANVLIVCQGITPTTERLHYLSARLVLQDNIKLRVQPAFVIDAILEHISRPPVARDV